MCQVRAAADVIQYEDVKRDFETLDAYKKFDVRMKAMSFFTLQLIDMTVESKPWQI